MQKSDFRAVQQLGSIVEAAAPQGTIDLTAQVAISGPSTNPTVGATGDARLFPSYTGYAYFYDSNGDLQTVQILSRNETVYTDLPKPMTPIKPI